MPDRALGEQDIAAEDHAEVLAVEADRAGAVPGGMDHLQRDVGHLEDPAILHLDLRGRPRVGGVPPGAPSRSIRAFMPARLSVEFRLPRTYSILATNPFNPG